jgi:hypothetical protein
MNNYIQLQDDIYFAALSIEPLRQVNIVKYRKLREQAEISWATIWQMPRNGCSGAGILCELPTWEVEHSSLPGPERHLILSFLVVEEPNINFTPTVGTGISAEEISETLLDSFHNLYISGIGNLVAERVPIKPSEDFPGCVSYRVSLRVRCPRTQSPRVPIPRLVSVNGVITFSNQESGDNADIYYTTDVSAPVPDNPAATKYSGSFDASKIKTIRWAARKSGYNLGNMDQVTNSTMQ